MNIPMEVFLKLQIKKYKFLKQYSMKTLILSIVFLITLLSASSQVITEDSIWFEGKYYPRSEYKDAKERYEKINYETWFMPGLSYSYYSPVGSDSTGNFKGIAVEYLIFGQVHQNDKPGPSHVRVYSKLNILKSDKQDVNSLFMYTLGLDLSLEKNPNRTAMIPFFGLEFGGMTQKQLGTTSQFTPTFGIHALSKKNLFINLQGGYVYPLRNFETFQGWTAQVGVNFAMW